MTYLPTQIAGRWFFLYLILDVYSRKIVGFEVHDSDDAVRQIGKHGEQDVCVTHPGSLQQALAAFDIEAAAGVEDDPVEHQRLCRRALQPAGVKLTVVRDHGVNITAVALKRQ